MARINATFTVNPRLSVHRVVGTERYTTSTTNMYHQRESKKISRTRPPPLVAAGGGRSVAPRHAATMSLLFGPPMRHWSEDGSGLDRGFVVSCTPTGSNLFVHPWTTPPPEMRATPTATFGHAAAIEVPSRHTCFE